jgi:thioredoxin reductase
VQRRVAVIGAGAAGLVTARELERAGHTVRVFEQQGDVGGVWRYDEHTESDPLGLDSTIHCSLYASLRTNLPRDLMAFLDFTFDSAGGGEDAWPRFPHHTQVLTYLERFADHFGLLDVIALNTRVAAVTRDELWRLRVIRDDVSEDLAFDAVAVCNGHYSQPRVPDLPGMEQFPGALMHSHNYRRPEVFRDQRVGLLGVSASGVDIHREVASCAARVYFCGHEFDALAEDRRRKGNIHYAPMIQSFGADGRVTFVDGSTSEPLDSFMFCTGYHFRFPFLDDTLVNVDDNLITPLYQHLLHIEQPTLGFIGVPLKVIPFPLFEMQAKWFAAVLTGSALTPDRESMYAAAALDRRQRMEAGVSQRNLHLLGPGQNDYYNLLARQCGEPPLPDWFVQLANAHFENSAKHGAKYKDMPLPAFGPTVLPPESVTGP